MIIPATSAAGILVFMVHSARSRRQVFDEIVDNKDLHVKLGAFAFMQAVVAVGIDEVVEAFARFDEAVHESFGDFDVRFGLAGTGDDEQIAAQSLCAIFGLSATMLSRLRWFMVHGVGSTPQFGRRSRGGRGRIAQAPLQRIRKGPRQRHSR